MNIEKIERTQRTFRPAQYIAKSIQLGTVNEGTGDVYLD